MGGQFCGRKPEGTGSYNSKSDETKFFSDYRSYDGFSGRFFLSWYSQVLIDHGDQVLAQANIVFQDQYEEFPEPLADPEDLVWQVLNDAWDVGIPVGAENALPCYGRQGFDKILQNAKPYGAPDGIHLSSFTYLRLSPDLVEGCHLRVFELLVKQMHGKSVTEFST
ncbi:UNVERIFIED_CONTAM: Beta-amylase 2, chloroplastic [Sesamum radiatum]|uniref:Beta-amylase n=1 Tax=Sesamum radiatum TaxID=300843 RepID=A0AAW2T150_SESRA